jgi:osmoprotectant transport system substrate-binding protein
MPRRSAWGRARGSARGLLIAAVAIAALLALAACGGTTRPAPAAATTHSTAAHSTTSTAATTTTATTTTATTTTVALPGAGHPPVVIGDKNTFPEQFVLGDLYEEALAAEGFSVSLNRNIGPTEVTLQALKSGSLGMYPEYIDVWDQSVAGYQDSFPSLGAAYEAGEQYALAHAFELLKPTPFSDTDGLAVTLEYAVSHGLNTIGDLRGVAATVKIGGPPQFEGSPTGLAGIEEAYGFAPAAYTSVAVGEQYTALEKGTIQAADVNTTDGQLLSAGYLLLNDPRHVFGWGNVVPVVSQKVLDEEGPTFEATVNDVSALLTTTVMRQLNAEVGLAHKDPATVAKQFLQAHDLMPAKQSH